MHGVAITQKWLASVGGWPALKQAQQLQAAGRVSKVSYAPPLLSGVVREGNRNLRSGLRIKSGADVENLCTCREAREWGRICPHALAVGLALIDSATAKPVPVAAAAPPAPAARNRPTFVEIGSEVATPVVFHFILPPTFSSAWVKKRIMVVTEVELGGRRVMPAALQPNERYTCDDFDLAAIDALHPDALEAVRTLSRPEFLQLLRASRGHPRFTFGKSKMAAISGEICRPRLRVGRGRDESLVLSLDKAADEELLVGGGDAWLVNANGFQPLPEALPEELTALAEGNVVFHGARAQRFLALEALRLREWFQVDAQFPLPDVQIAEPRFVLQLEGSLRELRAELQVRYVDGLHTLATELDVIRDPEHADALQLRNLDAEREAALRLEALGFIARGDRFVLNRENAIARFFAFEYPRLKSQWEVTLAASAAKVSGELEPLAPRIEVVGSGENWFELRYSLATPDGQTFSSSELQRLLRSGQTQTRLRNGKIGVFDAEAITDFEEVLRDSDPAQTQPGLYRIDRAHSDYLAATVGDVGVALLDVRGALARLTSASAAELPPLGDLEERLRDYQRGGVAWLWRLAQNNLGGILADEMGLGKTVQTLAFLRATRGDEPALIVCPSSLVTNWANEARRFTPELRVLVLEGPDRHARLGQISHANVALTSYALLQRDAEKYRGLKFSTVVLDEAQHIKNPDTQNAQAAFALRARNRFVLTGTPIENSVRDLWSIMNFVLPGYLGSRADFRERYEQPLARGPAPEVQRRLARRMRPFLLRRKKTEVAKELPEKIEQQLICDLTAEQRAAYDGLLREIQSGLTSSKGNVDAQRMKILVGLLRLRQVCCDLRLISDKTGSAKLELLDELLEEAIDGGHRVLVFSQFVSMLTLIREQLEVQKIPFSYLDGATKDRQSVVDRFQADNSIPVFLMSLKAGGVGLNLSAADTVIHFDPWWNYAVEAQATDRAHRIGQTRVVTAYKLIARDTVEEKIVKLQTRKRSASEATIGSEEPLMGGLTTEDLEELLS